MIFIIELSPAWVGIALAILSPLVVAAHRTFKRWILYQNRVDILWKRSKIEAAEEKHSPKPEHAAMDHLLEKAAAETLTDYEARELVSRLTDIARSEESLERAKTQTFIAMLKLDYDL